MLRQPSNATILDTSALTAHLEWSPAVAARLNAALRQTQRSVDSYVMQLVMKHTRETTGTLRTSTTLHTVIGSGEVRQSTPYAKKAHYMQSRVNLTKNPNARALWMPYVETTYREQILKLAQGVLKREFGGG